MRGWVQQALGLIAVSGLVFFTALGRAQLWDEDEPIFAGAAREMLARREWVVPYFNDRMLPDKPVLSYWVMMAGYTLWGPTEFAARAGSALFSLGSVLLTWHLGRRLFSPRAGVWAGFILATSVGFDIVARAATPDAVLTFFCTLSIVCYVRWLRLGDSSEPNAQEPPSHGGHWLLLAASYAAMGLAVLAKGPIGLMLPFATILLHRLFTAPMSIGQYRGTAAWQRVRALASRLAPGRIFAAVIELKPLMGLAVAMLVAAPWYFAVALRTEGAWLAEFFGKHNVARFLHPMEHHRGPIFYYLVAVLVGFFPWSVLLGPTAIFARSKLPGDGPDQSRFRLLVCWIAAYIGFFSLAATKLPNYIVPIYPTLALLSGAWIEAWLSGRQAVSTRLLQIAWTLLLVVGLAMAIALAIVDRRLLGGDPLLPLVGLPLVAGGAICWWWQARSRRTAVAKSLAATAILFSLAMFGAGSVMVGRHQSSRSFADAIRRQTGAGPALLRTFGYWRPSLVYYLGQPVQQMFGEQEIGSFCKTWPYHGFLLTTNDRYATIAGKLPADVAILARRRWFLRDEELLLLGRDESAQTRVGTRPWRESSNR